MNPILSVALEASVPLFIEEMKMGPFSDLMAEAPSLAQIIAEKGDIIQFRSKKKGETAAAFNALASAIAIGSFVPGGITFAGMHFEATHPDSTGEGR
jgi:hypothetical protein